MGACKAAILDLDNCIFDTSSLGKAVLDPVVAELREFPPELATRISEAMWKMSLEEVIRTFVVPKDTAHRMRSAYGALRVSEGVRTFGDEECLLMLPLYRVLVTTGLRSFQAQKIEKVGVSRLFDEVIIDATDEIAPRGKKAIFADLALRHGWDAREVLVVGDSATSELAAGRELGMRTVQTLRPTVVKAPGFDHYVWSLRELVAIVERP